MAEDIDAGAIISPRDPRLPEFFSEDDYCRALDAIMRFTAPRPWRKVRPRHSKPDGQGHDRIRQAIATWEERGFNESERLVYQAGGLRWHESDLADRCRAQGISPGDLRLVQHGRTMVDYLRSGESVSQVYARIREVA